MSPARVAEQARQDQQVETLTRGFDALLKIARTLALKEQDLQLKLKFAHDEVCTSTFFLSVFLLK
jgi:hypothetical protein